MYVRSIVLAVVFNARCNLKGSILDTPLRNASLQDSDGLLTMCHKVTPRDSLKWDPGGACPPTLIHGHFPRGYNDTIACEHRSRRSVHYKCHLQELPQVPVGPRRRASPNRTPLTYGHSRDNIQVRNTTVCEHPAYRRLGGSSMSALGRDCDGVLGGLISGLGSTLACYTKVGKHIRATSLEGPSSNVV